MQAVSQFVEECLSGNWKELANIDPLSSYDPMDPLADSDMLRCAGGRFDCDNCNLARAVYHDVWGLDAPLYRGYTMNSFRTAFGREWIRHDMVDNPRVFGGTESHLWPLLPERLRERIGAFYSTYHTIGNFLPLPNAKVDGLTLNTYRGTCEWHDYFSCFLEAVKVYLENEGEKVASLPPTFVRLMKANDFFWDDYKGCFDEYVEEFYLLDYLDAEGDVVERPVLRHGDSSLSIGDYIMEATEYLDFAEMVIRNRAARIIARLRGMDNYSIVDHNL